MPVSLAQRRKAAAVRQRKRRAADPWAGRKASRKYYWKNRAAVLARNSKWAADHPEYKNVHRRTHLARYAERQRMYRARKKWHQWVAQLARSRQTRAALCA